MACLKKWGLQRSDVGIVTLAPAQLVSAYIGGSHRLLPRNQERFLSRPSLYIIGRVWTGTWGS